jgi:hypothetical protein
MLAMHPTVVENLRAEYEEVFGSDPETIMEILQSTPHKLNGLHYTTAVIKETLSLFPVGFNARKEKPGYANSPAFCFFSHAPLDHYYDHLGYRTNDAKLEPQHSHTKKPPTQQKTK